MTVNREPQSLHEMLRILDVASTLRRERERAAAELDVDQTRQSLRQRLRAAADETGDAVTDAEIDAAIDQYHGDRHAYREPKASWRTVLAQVWVRRVGILGTAGALMAAGALAFVLFFADGAPFSPSRRAAARDAAVADRIDAAFGPLDAAATGADAKAAAAALRAEADALRTHPAPAELDRVLASAAALRARVEEAFELRVVSRPGERSGIDAYYEDEHGKRVSGYYLIVEAASPDGRRLSRRVRDAEHGDERSVTTWGEQVPKAVYDRVARDKQADGIVDDALFARKRRGSLAEEVVMKGEDGVTPLSRGRQITRDL